MKKLGLFIFMLFLNTALKAQPLARPKLVVGLVVDQMRWDYLYRFYNRYGADGFKRLLKQGFNCENTQIHYIPTYTAPGHATIYTGAAPALHGIVSNDWVENATGAAMYCTQDAQVMPVGSTNKKEGQMSPRNMYSSTVTDELRLATNFQSRVFGLSLKDRGSILPAGHLANHAFWYDNEAGNFISSTYYGSALPQWLVDFNNRRVSDSLMALPWETLYPINTYTSSDADDSKYEGIYKGENSTTFPHKALLNKEYDEIRKRPVGNTYTLMAAQACLLGEQLGKTNNTDFLCVSLSSTDYIGHLFGPNSIEVEDMYLRLDKELAAFLKFLDRHVGAGQYTLFLTADHGGAHNANYLKDKKMPAGLMPSKALYSGINAYAKSVLGYDSLIDYVMNYQVHINRKVLEKSNRRLSEVKSALINYLQQQPYIAYAVDMEQINSATIPDVIKHKMLNGYQAARCGDIQVIPHPAWYEGYAATGTTHGSWNPYDSHIPLLFYGWGVQPGATNRLIEMKDIAPTLAALLHIQEPNACMGEPITEAIKTTR